MDEISKEELQSILMSLAKPDPLESDNALTRALKERFGAEEVIVTDEFRERAITYLRETSLATKGTPSEQGTSQARRYRLRLIWAAGIAAIIAIVGLLTLDLGPSKRDQMVRRSVPPKKAPATSHQGQGPNPDRFVKGNSPTGIPEMAVAINDGGRPIGVDGEGNLVGLGGLSQSEQGAVRRALLTGAIVLPPEVARLRTHGSITLGPADQSPSFKVIGPAATRVLSLRPTFRWHALSDATGYTVTIVDDAKQEEVSHSPPVKRAAWRPDKAHPLVRGRVYRWFVVATRPAGEVQAPSPTASVARFEVLDSRSASALSVAILRAGSSHLAAGLAYAHWGLVDEARTQFAILVRANPKSANARRLLAKIEALTYRASPSKTNPDQK